MLTLPVAAAVLVAVAVGSAVQRIAGMGVGLVCSPVLALLLGPALGVTFTNSITVCSALVIGVALWRDADWSRLRIMLPSAVLGALPGALVVRELPTAWLNVAVGGLVCLALSTTWILGRFSGLPHVDGVVPRVTTGAVGAFLNTTAGVAGSVMVVYSALSRWDQRAFAASMQPTFLVMGLLSVVGKVAVGATPLADLPPVWFLGVVFLVIVVTVALAGRVADRVPRTAARTLAVVLAGTGAVVTLGRGVLQLVG